MSSPARVRRSLPSRIGRLFAAGVLAALAVLLVAYLGLPVAMRYALPRIVSGYGIPLTIDGASVQLLRERVRLHGVRVGDPRGANIFWEDVVVGLDTRALLRGRVRLTSFRMHDAEIHIEKLSDAPPWSTPGDAGANTALGVELGELRFERVALPFLSQRLGREAEIRYARFSGLEGLRRDAGAAFEIAATLGGAPAHVQGTLRIAGGEPEVDARVRVDGMALDGWEAVWTGAARTDPRGSLHAAGTLRARYDSAGGESRMVFQGSAAVDAFRGRVGNFRLHAPRLDWDGDAELRLPALGSAVEGEVSGRVVASVVDAEGLADTEDAGTRVALSAPAWEGTATLRAGVAAQGALRADALELAHPQSAGGAQWTLRVRAPRLEELESRVTEDGSGVHRAARVEIDGARLRGPYENAPLELLIGHLDAANAGHDAARGYAIGTLAVDQLSLDRGTGPAGTSLVLADVRAQDITRGEDGSVKVAALAAATLRGAGSLGELRAQALRMRAARMAPGGGVEAGNLSLATLHARNGEQEIWAEELSGQHVGVGAGGTLRSAELSVAELRQTGGAPAAWDASGITAAALVADVQGRAGATVLRFAALAVRAPPSGVWELSDVRVRAPAVETGVRAGGEGLEAATLRFTGDAGALELSGLKSDTPFWESGGAVGVASARAAAAVFTQSDASTWHIEAPELSAVRGNPAGALQAGAMAAAMVERRWGDGAGLRVVAARGRAVARSAEGMLSAGGIHADAVVYRDGEGREWGLDGLASQGLSREPAGRIRAAGIELEALRVEQEDASIAVGEISATTAGWRAAGRFDVEILEVASASGQVGETLKWRAGRGLLRNLAGDTAGRARMDQIALREYRATRADGYARFEFVRANAQGVRVDGWGSGSATQLDVEAMRLESGPAAARASVAVNGLRIRRAGVRAGGALALGEVEVSGLAGVMGWDESGRWQLPSFSRSGEERDPGGITVEALRTVGEDSRLGFYDHRLTPAYQFELASLRLTLTDFDSAPGGRGTFGLRASMGEFASLEVNGATASTLQGFDVQLQGKINALEMTRLAPYARKHLSVEITGGRGDADVTLAITDGELAGENQLLFSKLTLEPAKPVVAAGTDATVVPIATILSRIEDEQGIVKLTLPISGRLDDPKLDYFSAVFGRAVVRTAQSALTLAFRPVGLLTSATGLLTGMRFKPVVFAPGEVAVNAQGLTRLDTLAAELDRHPRVRIALCGKAVPADAGAGAETGAGQIGTGVAASGSGAPAPARPRMPLLALAKARGDSVREYLVARHAVSAHQLLDCPPDADSDPHGVPRLEIVLRTGARGKVRAAPASPPAVSKD